MQVVKKLIGYTLLIWFAVILFMPKENLYYQLERVAAQEGIEINEASIKSGVFTLSVRSPEVYYEGVAVASAEALDATVFLLYDRVIITGIALDRTIASMVPLTVDKVELVYSILTPQKVTLKGEGSFGRCHGEIDLKERRVHISMDDPEKIGSIKSLLKKGEEGWYYETSF